VLVVYDIADMPSFDATTVFLQDIRKYARPPLGMHQRTIVDCIAWA
jgi:hypothetical protein